jgi:1-acyl-sn-glycerol-3-phosphate acyltransferase
VLRRKWIAAPLSLLFWATCVAVVVGWTPFVLLYRALTFPFDRDRMRVGRIVHDMAVTAANLNPFWTFQVVDPVHPDPRQPYIFVANHSSFTDVFVLARLPWEMKWLSKKSIFNIPLLGWQMRIAWDIPVVRGDRDSSRRAVEEMRKRLQRRVSIVVFPEGTRVPGGAPGEFREGAFRLAIEGGVEIVPLAIVGAAEGLPKNGFILHPAHAVVYVLPPVPTIGLTSADARRLASDVRARIAAKIEEARSAQSSNATSS